MATLYNDVITFVIFSRQRNIWHQRYIHIFFARQKTACISKVIAFYLCLFHSFPRLPSNTGMHTQNFKDLRGSIHLELRFKVPVICLPWQKPLQKKRACPKHGIPNWVPHSEVTHRENSTSSTSVITAFSLGFLLGVHSASRINQEGHPLYVGRSLNLFFGQKGETAFEESI